MAHTIIQWNCRGLRANYPELQILIHDQNPVAICLQELLISDTYSFPNRKYTLYSKVPPLTNNQPSGGVGVLIRKGVPHSQIPLNSRLWPVAYQHHNH